MAAWFNVINSQSPLNLDYSYKMSYNLYLFQFCFLRYILTLSFINIYLFYHTIIEKSRLRCFFILIQMDIFSLFFKTIITIKEICHSSPFLLSQARYKMDLLLPYWTQYFYFNFFFLEGTVTHPAIWLVLSAVRIFLSLSTGAATLSWVAEYIPTFVAIFHKYISFSRLGSIFKKRRRSLH